MFYYYQLFDFQYLCTTLYICPFIGDAIGWSYSLMLAFSLEMMSSHGCTHANFLELSVLQRRKNRIREKKHQAKQQFTQKNSTRLPHIALFTAKQRVSFACSLGRYINLYCIALHRSSIGYVRILRILKLWNIREYLWILKLALNFISKIIQIRLTCYWTLVSSRALFKSLFKCLVNETVCASPMLAWRHAWSTAGCSLYERNVHRCMAGLRDNSGHALDAVSWTKALNLSLTAGLGSLGFSNVVDAYSVARVKNGANFSSISITNPFRSQKEEVY